MKKCVYCETKKMINRTRSPGRFFSQCDYCNNRNKLAEERNSKILQSKRYALNAFDDMKNCELSGILEAQ